MNIKWAIQVTLISMADSNGLHDAITSQGMECLPVYMVPFQDDLPEVEGLDPDDNVIFYGSTKLIQLLSGSKHYKDSVWFDHNKFLYSHHIELNGDLMLNHDAEIVKLGYAIERETPFFARPLGDLKKFSGEIINELDDLARWQDKLKMAGLYDFLDMDIMIAEPKKLLSEYRCFVVDNKVVSAAKYINAGCRKDAPVDGDELNNLQGIVSNAIMPMPVVCCDIALTPDGYKIIEFNTMNGSGFYGHDKDAIVSAISQYKLDHS